MINSKEIDKDKDSKEASKYLMKKIRRIEVNEIKEIKPNNETSKGVFPVTPKNAFVPVERVYSVNTYS